jgi:hypothetical protein
VKSYRFRRRALLGMAAAGIGTVALPACARLSRNSVNASGHSGDANTSHDAATYAVSGLGNVVEE